MGAENAEWDFLFQGIAVGKSNMPDTFRHVHDSPTLSALKNLGVAIFVPWEPKLPCSGSVPECCHVDVGHA